MNLEQKLVRLVSVAAVTLLLALAVTTFVLYALGFATDQQAEARGSPWNVRVGTFDRIELLQAYYGSTIHDAVLEALIVERDAAREAGDEARVAEIEARGAASQELAHRQLAGEATLGNILPHLETTFPEIAQERNLVLIVEQPLWAGAEIESVDVTGDLTARFEPAK